MGVHGGSVVYNHSQLATRGDEERQHHHPSHTHLIYYAPLYYSNIFKGIQIIQLYFY